MRSKFLSTVFAAISALLLSSCSAPKDEAKPVDMAQLKTEIQAKEDAFAAGEKIKNADSVVTYYSDDAISYGRNEEPASGKAAIREKLARDIAKDTTGNNNVYKVVDLFAEGNQVVEIGSWTRLNTSGTEVDKGYYMSVFQKRDGKYVCVRDMSVTTTPLKKPM